MNSRFYAGPIIVTIIVFCLLLAFYTAYDKNSKELRPAKVFEVLSFKDQSTSLRELNKIFALESIGLISLVFLVGPLSKIKPRIFARFLPWRKPVGIIGFVLALLHAAYSIVFLYGLNLEKIFFSNPKLLGVLSGIIALIIFFLMTITSTKSAVEKMGYANWKKLQITGYIALFFSIIHFVILETKPDIGFDVRPFGQLFLLISVLALVLRVIATIHNLPQRKSFEEHTTHFPK